MWSPLPLAPGSRGVLWAPRGLPRALAAIALLGAPGCSCDDTGNTRAKEQPPDAAADVGHDVRAPATGTGGSPPVPPGSGGALPEAGAPDAPVEASADALPDAPPVVDARVDAAPDALPDAPPDAPLPVSLFCGDAVRGLDEECDDGNDVETDFCSWDCRSRDALLVGPTESPPTLSARRTIVQDGRPVAAGPLAGGALFSDPAGAARDLLMVGLVKPDGEQVGDGRGIVLDDERWQSGYEDAALVALPDGRFVAAWSSIQVTVDPGVDVSLRTIDALTGALGPTLTANEATFGQQYVTDAVWTGSELVVAWVDGNLDPPATASYVRRFDAELEPLGGDERLAAEHTSVFGPFLSAFAGGFAHGWVSNEAIGRRSLWVRAGGREWSFGPYASVESPSLVALGDRHLFLFFGERPFTGGSHLWGAVLDVEEPAPPTLFPVLPLLPPPQGFGEIAETQPSLAVAGDAVYVAWTLTQNSFSRGIFLKTIPWRHAEGGGQLEIDLSLPEISLPSSPERRDWPHEHAAIVHAPWGPSGALFAASEDGNRTLQPDMRRPDVVVQALPLPILRRPEEVSRDL